MFSVSIKTFFVDVYIWKGCFFYSFFNWNNLLKNECTLRWLEHTNNNSFKSRPYLILLLGTYKSELQKQNWLIFFTTTLIALLSAWKTVHDLENIKKQECPYPHRKIHKLFLSLKHTWKRQDNKNKVKLYLRLSSFSRT